MKCDEFTELINLEIDGLLTAHQTEKLHSHLHSCPECVAKRVALRRASRQLAALKAVRLPPGFHRMVMARIEELAPERIAHFGRNALIGAVIGVLGFLLLLLPLLGHSSTPPAELSVSQVETEVESDLPQITPAVDDLTNASVSIFDSVLQNTSAVRVEFIVGTCLILVSMWAMFLYLIDQEERTAAGYTAKDRQHA